MADSCGHLPAPPDMARDWGRLTDGGKIDGGVWGIDGSGGKYSKDWRLRRCDWSFAHLGVDGRIDAVRCGSLPCARQSSPRAELYALIQLLKASCGDRRVYRDCLLVVKGARKSLRAKRKSSMLDLWTEFHRVLKDNGGSLNVLWTKGHPTRAQAENMFFIRCRGVFK